MGKINLGSTLDAHLHFRQDELMKQIAAYSINQFGAAILMPNTNPKLTSYDSLLWYKKQVKSVIQETGKSFLPLYTMYLSKSLQLDDIRRAWNEGILTSIKYYPKGGTTGSDEGELGFANLKPQLELMQKLGIPLNIHGETPEINGEVVDDYEREMVFYEGEMVRMREMYPELPIALEHITTKEAAEFTMAYKKTVATITPGHLLFDRRSLHNYTTTNDQGEIIVTTEKSGIIPDFMKRPILKHRSHVLSLRDHLIIQHKEGLQKFGLGTDSAVHPPEKKYCECGACGVFSAPIAMQMYAMAFDEMNLLEHLPAFACDIMPNFYGIKDKMPNRNFVLTKGLKDVKVENNYNGYVTPLAGQNIAWSIAEVF